MITGIRLTGRGLVEETNLNFFPRPATQRISVVFGRNGTGKTTIGDGFARYSVAQRNQDIEHDSNDLNASLLLDGKSQPDAYSRPGLSTLVFNEQFIENNVRITDDGIRSLVLFGKSASTQDDLDKATVKAKKAREKLEIQQNKQVEASEKVETAKLLLTDSLRKGWADRERIIRGNKNNSSVTQNVVDTHLNRPLPQESLETLRSDFDRVKERLLRSRGGEEILVNVSSEDTLPIRSAFDSLIFERVIAAPTGEGLAALVAKALETHGPVISSALSVFDPAGPHLSHCPLCLQEISDVHQTKLLEAIKNAADKPAEEFSNQLDRSLIAPLDLRLDARLAELDQSTTEAVKHLTSSLNAEISRWNETVVAKKSSLYAPIAAEFDIAAQLLSELRETLNTLERARLDWNASVNDTRTITATAQQLNLDLSRLESNPLILVYQSTLIALESEGLELTKLDTTLTTLEDQVKEFRKGLLSEDVAADEINYGLATVFADANRLRIVVADDSETGGRFMLQSRGRPLKPNRLSVGERNILSLCYFFTLLKQCIDARLDLQKTLIVLDDPISSVDIDCRIGILSYLEEQLKDVLNRNSSVRAVLLTHDASIFQDLGRTSQAILESLDKPHQGEWQAVPWILRNTGSRESIRVSLARHEGGFAEPLHEYRSLLGYAFNFANSDPSSQASDIASIGVGNALRRAYEAFGVFIYGQKSITANNVIDAYASLGRGDLGPSIRQALVTVLHGGSHYRDGMLQLRDFGAGSSVDSGEAVIVVRKILALMYAVQPHHMRSYLANESAPVLDKWLEEHFPRTED